MIQPTRRDFLKILLASSVAEALDVEKLLWTPKPIITVPELPLSLYGIPYHQTNWILKNKMYLYGGAAGGGKSFVYNELSKLIEYMKVTKVDTSNP